MGNISVYKLGTEIQLYGVLAMWIVILLRIPAARRSRQQRMLLLAVAGMAGSITIYLAPVLSALNALPGIVVQGCGLFTNLWGVFSSALVLDFVLAAMGRRRAKLIYSVTAAVLVTLVALNLTVFPNDEGCVTTNQAEWYSTFWWILIASHLVAKIPCVVLCLRYALNSGGDRSLRIGLSLFAAAFTVSTIFWLTMLYVLLFDARWLGVYTALIIGITTVLMTAGAALPLVLDTAQMVRDMRVLWRLWPLWRDLVEDVPHVALSKPQPRIRDLLGTPRSTYLRLYRRVIEIRDAMLILRDYVTPETVEQARAHVEAQNAPADTVQAAVTACWLEVARQAKRSGVEPTPNPLTFTELEGDDLPSEIAFLLDVADVRTQPMSASFAKTGV